MLEGVWAARWLTNLERPAGTPLRLDAGAARARELLTGRGDADNLDPEISDPDAKTLAIVGIAPRFSSIRPMGGCRSPKRAGLILGRCRRRDSTVLRPG